MPQQAETKFDLFLSHNSADKTVVEEIARKLQKFGSIRVWLDSWELGSGEIWQEKLEEALVQSAGCAIFLGSGGFAKWQLQEMRVANVLHAERPEYKIIPVLLPGGIGKNFPLFIRSNFNWVDFRSGLNNEHALSQLIESVLGKSTGQKAINEKDQESKEPPFKGLAAFEESDKEYFVGRELFVEQHLVEHLRHSRFLALVGISGSGKSSVVRAGLIPALRQGQLLYGPTSPILTMKPGSRPLEELAVALLELQPNRDLGKLIDDLGRDERTLHLAFRASKAPSHLLLIDQFEEIFTLTTSEEERVAFLKNLVYAASLNDSPLLIVITMRSDFLSKCSAYRDINALISENLVQIPQMSATELRLVIAEPAKRAGLEYEAGLVEKILADVSGASVPLPLLAHTLLTLWQQRDHRMMIHSAYEEIGGVRGSLARHADTVFKKLTSDEQITARRIFLRLVSPGEGTEDTRRRATKHEILGLAENAESTIEVLSNNRLIVTSRDPTSGEERIEVVHEALIRGWPMLSAWLDHSREFMRFRQKLTDDAQEWEKRKRDSSELYRGAHLLEAIEFLEQHPTEFTVFEREFIFEGKALFERETLKEHKTLRRFRRLSATLAILFIGAGIIAFWANQQRCSAKVRELVAVLQQMKNGDPILRLQLAIEAYDMNQEPETEIELRQALASANEASTFRFGSTICKQAFLADNKMVVLTSDTVMHVIDLLKNKLINQYKLEHYSLGALTFSTNGLSIAYPGDDTTLILADAVTGHITHKWLKGKGFALTGSSVMWSLIYDLTAKWVGNRILLWGRPSQGVILISADSGTIIREWNGSIHPFIDPSGKMVVLETLIPGSALAQFQFMDIETGKTLQTEMYPPGGLAFSNNSRFFYITKYAKSYNYDLSIYDAITHKIVYSESSVSSFRFRDDDSMIAINAGGVSKVRDTKNFDNIVTSLPTAEDEIFDQFSSHYLTTTTGNQKGNLYSLIDGKKHYTLDGPSLSHVYFSSDFHEASIFFDSVLRIYHGKGSWDAPLDYEVESGADDASVVVERIPTGIPNHSYFFNTTENKLELRDISKHIILKTITFDAPIIDQYVSSDMRSFIIQTADSVLHSYDAMTEKELPSLRYGPSVRDRLVLEGACLLNKNPGLAFLVDKLVDLRTGKIIIDSIRLRSFISPNGRFAIRNTSLYDLEDKPILLRKLHPDEGYFSNGTGNIIPVHTGHSISLADTKTGAILMTIDSTKLDGSNIKLYQYRFSSDDALFLITIPDGSTLVFDSHTGNLKSRFEGKLLNNWQNSGNEKYIITQTPLKTMIYDLASFQLLGTLPTNNTGWTYSSPDGKYIQLGSPYRIYYTDPKYVLRDAKAKLRELETNL